MVIVGCPYPGCIFNTDVPGALAVIHASDSHSGGTPDSGQNSVTPTTTPTTESSAHHYIYWQTISEAWSYFNIRGRDHVTVTKISGQDCVFLALGMLQ